MDLATVVLLACLGLCWLFVWWCGRRIGRGGKLGENVRRNNWRQWLHSEPACEERLRRKG